MSVHMPVHMPVHEGPHPPRSRPDRFVFHDHASLLATIRLLRLCAALDELVAAEAARLTTAATLAVADDGPTTELAALRDVWRHRLASAAR